MSQFPSSLRPRPRHRFVAAVIGLGLVATACGADGDDTASGVASLGDTESASAPVDDAPDREAPDDPEDAFALFDECMTEFGFELATQVGGGSPSISVEVDALPEGVPDPQQGSGDIADFDFDDFEAANEECGAHLANIDAGFDLSPEQEAAFEDAQLAWQDCMADQGIELPELDGTGDGVIALGVEAPEPDPQGGVTFDSSDFDFSGFEDAAKECEHVFEGIDALSAEDDQ